MMLRLALLFEPGIVITSVPYQVGAQLAAERPAAALVEDAPARPLPAPLRAPL